jgi:hypothetical protein
VASFLEALGVLRSGLDAVEAKSATAAAALGALQSYATASVQQVEAQVSRVAAVTDQAAAAVATVSSHASEVERAAGAAGAAVDQLQGHAGRAQTLAEEVAAKLKETAGHVTGFDDLLAAVTQSGNTWAQHLAALLELAKVGAIDIRTILTLYGEAETSAGRVRDILKNSDLAAFSHQLGEWIAEINRGHKTLGEIIEFVGRSQTAAAQALKTALEGFQQGKVTLEHVRRILEQIEKQFAGTDFADLARALDRSLAEGKHG